MAFSHRIITQRTRLFAVLLAVGVIVAGILAVELYPTRTIEPREPPPQTLTTHASHAPRAVDNHPFPPLSIRADDAMCAWTAEQVQRHWDASGGDEDRLVHHGLSSIRLIDAYLDLGCPNRIHDGQWAIAVEILRVGVVADAIAATGPYTKMGERLPAGADRLIESAATTFHILEPETMCREATRGSRDLWLTCEAAVGWYY